jgi:hypothetical protein
MDIDERKKSFLDWVSSNALIITIITTTTAALITTASYFGRAYFDPKFKEAEQTSQFKKDTYKKYYEKSKSVIQDLRRSESELFLALQEKYGFSTFELEKTLSNFRKARSSYDNYVSELELYGNSDQIESAKDIQNWSENVFSEFASQYNLAKTVQDSIQEMIVGSYEKPIKINPQKYIDFHLNGILDNKHKVDGILDKIDKMVQGENNLYYRYREVDMPTFDLLCNQLIYNFRSSIGLGITSEIEKSYKNAKKINKIAKEVENSEENSNHKDNSMLYVIAESRAIFSRDFSGSVPELKIKNAWLKSELLAKLMNQVAENNPYLKKKRDKNIRKSRLN